MKTYKADLHIHTCLSPCANLEMSPRNIAKQAKKKHLDIIGICDHNSCENIPFAKKAAEEEGLCFVGGIEITSKEEVHIIGLFNNEQDLFAIQKIVYDNLYGINDDKLYGDQVVVNDKDEVIDFNTKLLIGATELSVEDITHIIHDLKGLAIASHIDRESFGIIGQLGFIPVDLQLDALEVSNYDKVNQYTNLNFPLIASSDAHQLNAIGKNFTRFFLEEVNIEEIKQAFLGENNRAVLI